MGDGFAGPNTANYPVVSLPGQPGLWYQQPGGLYTQLPNSGPVGPSSSNSGVGPSSSNTFSMAGIGGSTPAYGSQFANTRYGSIALNGGMDAFGNGSGPLVTENEGWMGEHGGRWGGILPMLRHGIGGPTPPTSPPATPYGADPGYAHASAFDNIFFGDRKAAPNPFTYF